MEIAIDIVFEQHNNGRYFVTSDDIPGFRMAGFDIDAIEGDLNAVVCDLLRYNAGFIVSQLRWVPSLEDIRRQVLRPRRHGTVRYVANGTMAV